MKILHTSDWHLGQSLYNHDRTEEQAYMLGQITRIVREEQPDALLVSGDIFDTGQPSAAVQRMFTDSLVSIHEACPAMTIVCTAGNHDSPSRHEIFRQPWLSLNVHSIGQLDKACPERHIIRLPGLGYIIAVPYCYERNMPEGFFQRLLDLVAEENNDHLPVVMMAHTTMENSDLRGHKAGGQVAIGGIETTTISQVGHGYDYLALGHIHHAQWVKGTDKRARYSGSPLQTSFDEDYDHSVSLVNIPRHGSEASLRTISIPPIRPLVTLPANGYAEWEEAREMLADFPDDHPAYIRLNITSGSILPPNAFDEAKMLTQDKECRFCIINREHVDTSDIAATTLSISELKQMSPLDIARQYAEQRGCTFDDEIIKLFNQATQSASEE